MQMIVRSHGHTADWHDDIIRMWPGMERLRG
jgi:hypothetical protein